MQNSRPFCTVYKPLFPLSKPQVNQITFENSGTKMWHRCYTENTTDEKLRCNANARLNWMILYEIWLTDNAITCFTARDRKKTPLFQFFYADHRLLFKRSLKSGFEIKIGQVRFVGRQIFVWLSCVWGKIRHLINQNKRFKRTVSHLL